jgi:hypothetical protein
MSRRTAISWLIVAALVTAGGVGTSGATFTAASASPGNAVASAADFNTVAVSLADPGSPVRGSVPLSATASSDRGVTGVTFQRSPAGAGTWTDVCTDTTAPYGCAWTPADGTWDLRAVATDSAGYARSSLVAARLADGTAPAPTVADPGPWLQGTAAISASATDGGSGVVSLTVQERAAGASSWSDLCSATSGTATCSLATAALPDGDRELRAVATDAAGNTGTSAVVTRRVDNTAPTVSVDAGAPLRGSSAAVTMTAGDGTGTGVAAVALELRRVGTIPWLPACADTTAPYGCTLDSTTLTDGATYELRATATDGRGLLTTSALATRQVDNTAPTSATLAMTATTLRGSVALTGGAADTGSGVASWTVQYRPSGGSTWTDACAATAAPWACTWDTTTVSGGLYDLRALVADAAGNTLASTVQTNRRVDNDPPTVTLADPGTALRGTVSLSATATDPSGSGVAQVVFERRPTGGAWTTICTVAAAPYTCSWVTTTLADGTYDVQARATDVAGNQATSLLAGRTVDNTAPRAVDIQSGNGGATVGRMEAGDWLDFTFSEALKPQSVLAGWTGAATAVTVKLVNTGNNDTLSVDDAAGTTLANLTPSATNVSLAANYVTAASAFNATMTQNGATIRITLGSLRSGTVTTNANAKTMGWSPSTLATDPAGNAVTSTAATETGAADVDF